VSCFAKSLASCQTKCQDLFFLFWSERWFGTRDVSCLAEAAAAQSHLDHIPLGAIMKETGQNTRLLCAPDHQIILVGLRVVTKSCVVLQLLLAFEGLFGLGPPAYPQRGKSSLAESLTHDSPSFSCLISNDLVSKCRSVWNHLYISVPETAFTSGATLFRSPSDPFWPQVESRMSL
jgi:hypothetical protein